AVLVSETKVNFEEGEDDETRYTSVKVDNRTISINLNQAPRQTLFKAYHTQTKKDQSLLRFNNLKEELAIKSVDDAFKDEFIGSFKISVVVPSNDKFKDLNDIERFALIK